MTASSSTDWRKELSAPQRAKLARLETRLSQLQIQAARAGAPKVPVVRVQRTEAQRQQERDRRVALIHPSTHVKAAWSIGSALVVGLWNPADLMDGSAAAVVVDGVLPSKKNPDKLSIKEVITGEQHTYWGAPLSGLLASAEHATEAQWLALQALDPQAVRKDKAPKAPKPSRRRKAVDLEALI